MSDSTFFVRGYAFNRNSLLSTLEELLSSSSKFTEGFSNPNDKQYVTNIIFKRLSYEYFAGKSIFSSWNIQVLNYNHIKEQLSTVSNIAVTLMASKDLQSYCLDRWIWDGSISHIELNDALAKLDDIASSDLFVHKARLRWYIEHLRSSSTRYIDDEDFSNIIHQCLTPEMADFIVNFKDRL